MRNAPNDAAEEPRVSRFVRMRAHVCRSLYHTGALCARQMLLIEFTTYFKKIRGQVAEALPFFAVPRPGQEAGTAAIACSACTG